MRKALCLVVLGCALVVGLACSGDSSTPTAPAATSGLQSTTVESAEKIYLCHGQKNQYPYGVVVEVSDETYKRHFKHLNNNLDCECDGFADVGESCLVYQDPYFEPTCNNSCPGEI
jgi:hypothetical protein